MVESKKMLSPSSDNTLRGITLPPVNGVTNTYKTRLKAVKRLKSIKRRW
jgi:hypothetical protein